MSSAVTGDSTNSRDGVGVVKKKKGQVCTKGSRGGERRTGGAGRDKMAHMEHDLKLSEGLTFFLFLNVSS